MVRWCRCTQEVTPRLDEASDARPVRRPGYGREARNNGRVDAERVLRTGMQEVPCASGLKNGSADRDGLGGESP
jgi:hypothetical protein